MNRLTIAIAALAVTAAAGTAVAGEVGELTSFTAGTPARAGEVNGNFNTVAEAVNDNHARLTEVETAIAEPAGGDLSGSYPNLEIAEGTVTREKLSPDVRIGASVFAPAGIQVEFTQDGTDLTAKPLGAPAEVVDAVLSGTHLLLVYMSFSGRIYQLPYSSNAGGAANTIDYYVGSQPGVADSEDIYITRFRHDQTGTTAIGGMLNFRYLLIPQGEVITP